MSSFGELARRTKRKGPSRESWRQVNPCVFILKSLDSYFQIKKNNKALRGKELRRDRDLEGS